MDACASCLYFRERRTPVRSSWIPRAYGLLTGSNSVWDERPTEDLQRWRRATGMTDDYSINRLSKIASSTLWFSPGSNATGIDRSMI